ncbi:NYN domain-containing protein [Nocardioides aequoreus]|uniref:NYN domain-containing protein n=1 Tax=Nocardioides aequoreus TaxID=397278 RepID=UPI0004C39A53|nr:NYN domain-containing protein [Nocardioides aequoreus]
MKKTANINFRAVGRTGKVKTRSHRLPICEETGLVRYRDRHQARDGVKVLATSGTRASTFSCHACRGFHTEVSEAAQPAPSGTVIAAVESFQMSIPSRKRRYFLVDIENPTRGAKATCEEVATFWNILKGQAPGIAPHDHVVVGASRGVAQRYRSSITGANVRWVTGANAPDGADHALLAAIDLYRVARHYDELVIVSGDGCFSALARRAKTFGLSVQVVTAETPQRRPMLSRELSAVADVHTLVRLKARPNRAENLRRLNLLKASVVSSVSIEAVAA